MTDEDGYMVLRHWGDNNRAQPLWVVVRNVCCLDDAYAEIGRLIAKGNPACKFKIAKEFSFRSNIHVGPPNGEKDD